MKKQKDRLVELLKEVYPKTRYIPMEECREKIADAILADGWMRPSCKVGNIVHVLWEIPTPDEYVIYAAEVKEIKITKRNGRITYGYVLAPLAFVGRTREYLDEDFDKLFFLTNKEAETKLKERTLK